jgi:selenocysteine-specific elongation factor
MKHVIIGTAGHVDHGKSALVKGLTGTDPDRWEEEKRRGITLDLGFAELDLGGGVHAGFVDVPGHERFVKNMLAGAGGMDLVLLVIAADEGIKPQTREHFDICRLLAIERGVIALSKRDLVSQDTLDLLTIEVQEFVAGSFLEGAPIVAVSAQTGAGLDTLRAELRRAALAATPRPAASPFRLPIDRAFIMKGFGTVVTGTLLAGRIEREQEVEIFPLARRARVRGIQVHNRTAEAAVAGQRTALNLSGVDAQELDRGMMIAPPGLFEPASRLDAWIEMLPTAPALKNHSRLHFHCGTAKIMAEVALLDRKELAPGGGGFAQLRLASSGLFLPGDRFIFRQFSPMVTLGGGVVLDNQPPSHRFADPAALEALARLKGGGATAQIEHHLAREGEITIPALVARTGCSPQEILNATSEPALKGLARPLGQPPSSLAHDGYFAELRRSLETELKAFHESNPLLPGLSREDLRARLGRRPAGKMQPPSPLLVSTLIQEMQAQARIVAEGELVRLAGRSVQLTPEESAAKDKIAAAFERAGLAVPDAAQVLSGLRLDRGRAEKILQLLLKEGTLVRVTQDLIFHAQALSRLKESVRAQKAKSNRMDVAVFKALTGLTRKYAIPLLEYLDRERVTRRAGDERIIL